jgi:hypothetical protein
MLLDDGRHVPAPRPATGTWRTRAKRHPRRNFTTDHGHQELRRAVLNVERRKLWLVSLPIVDIAYTHFTTSADVVAFSQCQ